MLGHPGGEKHSRYLIELAFLEAPCKWLDMGAGDGETVRLLRSLGYSAEGIDLAPRGKDVTQGNFLEAPWQDGFFDGIISQCSFYVGGNVAGALCEASRLLRKGGKLVFSDVTENVVQLLRDCRKAGFAVCLTGSETRISFTLATLIPYRLSSMVNCMTSISLVPDSSRMPSFLSTSSIFEHSFQLLSSVR